MQVSERRAADIRYISPHIHPLTRTHIHTPGVAKCEYEGGEGQALDLDYAGVPPLPVHNTEHRHVRTELEEILKLLKDYIFSSFLAYFYYYKTI